MDYLQYQNNGYYSVKHKKVLNLIINGLPSIRNKGIHGKQSRRCFKPYYKWITFNTLALKNGGFSLSPVLNLIINGLPSIPLPKG